MNIIRKASLLMSAVLIAAGTALGQASQWPVRGVAKSGVVTTRQAITPAGEQSIFSGRIYAVAFGPSDQSIYVALSSGGIYQLDWRRNRVLREVQGARHPGMQGMILDRVTGEPLLSAIHSKGKGKSVVQLAAVSGQSEKVIAADLGTDAVGEVSAAAENNPAGERLAGVALTFNDAVAVVDLNSGRVMGTVKTGIAPFGVAVNKQGTVAYVSNWGGRFATPHDLTRTTGVKPGADRVVVDRRGIASTGTVTRVDLRTMKVTNQIETGLHPTALDWDQARARLYVTDSNSGTVSVIDTRTNRVAQTIAIRPFQGKTAGVAPNGVAVSPDGATLYVACGGLNAIAVVRTSDGHLEGMIPTAWYPNDLRISAVGGTCWSPT